MGCDVGCPFIGRAYNDNWKLEDPTGKTDDDFRAVSYTHLYGMGHAVYSISDPRERVFKGFVEQLARDKGREKDMTLYNNIDP